MNNKNCPKCGKEIPADSVFCPYCMAKFNKNSVENQPKNHSIKKVIIICVCVLLALAIATAGTVYTILALNAQNRKEAFSPAVSNKSDSVSDAADKKGWNGIDNDIGLKNIKVDSNRITDDNQRIIAEFFDNDYIDVHFYDFLARYPTIFENSQIRFKCKVQKVIKADDTNYEILVWMGKSEFEFYYRGANGDALYEDYLAENANNLLVVKGKHGAARLKAGDEIVVCGRYTKIETKEIDGTTYVIPTVNAYRTYEQLYLDGDPQRFNAEDIKKVAKALFGNNVEVRDAVDGEDYNSNAGTGRCQFYAHPFMICELEDQSNAKFTKYRIYNEGGLIEDAKSASLISGTGTAIDDSPIMRKIEFAPDFEHYFVYTFDSSLHTLTLGYYDSNLEKVWQREFDEALQCTYDYTKHRFYLVVNGDFYIINVDTGEDVAKPSYVGQKFDIRKIEDGLIMQSNSQADAVIKVDLNGNIVWKTNIISDNFCGYGYASVQFIDDKIVLADSFAAFELDAKTGKINASGEISTY